MQPGPAHQLYGALLQVKILCQNCFNVRDIRVIIHRAAELDDATEFVATAVIRIGQLELCVVFGRHGRSLR